jgi:uncharacterized damage-inducible protein DinB
MADLKEVARLVRWAADSMAFQLAHIPEDKLDWQPQPGCKSALTVAGEVVFVIKSALPVFTGGTLDFEVARTTPTNLAEAQQWLAETSTQFADLLEAAGPEMDRPIDTPFGQLWGTSAVTFGLVDLLHHHGQLTYIQSLLGDAENHMDMGGLMQYFGVPKA